jgi:hypothetical protein
MFGARIEKMLFSKSQDICRLAVSSKKKTLLSINKTQSYENNATSDIAFLSPDSSESAQAMAAWVCYVVWVSRQVQLVNKISIQKQTTMKTNNIKFLRRIALATLNIFIVKIFEFDDDLGKKEIYYWAKHVGLIREEIYRNDSVVSIRNLIGYNVKPYNP